MEHTVEHASACSHSCYTECTCGEKSWGRTRVEADLAHLKHAVAGVLERARGRLEERGGHDDALEGYIQALEEVQERWPA